MILLDMTFGADGTTHRSINYNARHAHYKTEAYSADDNNTPEQKTRLLGVHSALDGSSEQSIQAWKELLSNIADIYNQSPLAKRTNNLLQTIDIFIKLRGMHSDHCAKEKKDVQMMEKEKLLATYQSLGEDKILEESNEELLPHFLQAKKDMILAAGGNSKWQNLSQIAQAEHEAVMLEQLVIKLGKDSFDLLSEDEKRILKLFVWAGCGCHKDLNTVRGGNVAMMAWWKNNNIPGPVLLANRDNAAVLKSNKSTSNTTSAVQERALNVTTCGGVKATQLAGDILNHKNDKKGHHDTFRWWWLDNLKEQITFPDTSNTRFQSHCDAAAALIKDLPHFIKFLEFVREKKQVMRFSHMEENLWKALHCTATKTELAVLALYAQSVTHPYMRHIRGSESKNLNALDLGPLHKKVYNHIMRIVQDPTFLLGPAVTYETGTMDGEPWTLPEVIAAIHKLAPELPHLSSVLVAFFKGAAETWKRFISEFAPGGLIDEATADEKDFAWMPPTNDVNEGALGAFRVLMRKQPQLTLLQYNAQAMFYQNETQAFMDNNFQSEDYQFIRKKAREAEANKLESKRKKELVQYIQAKNAQKMTSKKKREDNAVKKAERVAAVQLVFDREEVKKLKGDRLKDQLLAFQQAGAPIPRGITTRTPVAQIREALQSVIDSFHSGKWELLKEGEDTESAEDFDLEEVDSEESEWEDFDE
jgi:hypothetical protein